MLAVEAVSMNQNHTINITTDLVEAIATRAVKQAFRDIGIDDGNAFEMRKDMAHLREWRLTCEGVKARGVLAVMSLMITGVVALIILGFRQWIFH